MISIMMGLMMLGMVVVAVVIIVGIVLLIRAAWARAAGEKAKNSAESVLRERFARGEIDPEEFQERLDLLRSQRPGNENP